jgi:integrase
VDIKQTKSVSSYANYLKTFKVYYRDFLKQPEIIQDYKFPKQSFKPKFLPSKEEIRIFYNALSDRYKIIFLALASSGLRINELLSAEIIGTMVIPKSHNGQTKQSYISFINDETISLLKQYQGNPFSVFYGVVDRTFKKTSKKFGIKIYPHLLRSVFAREMSKAGVQDRYIDAFCGRVPGSVLARHYSDYSPEVLKDIYSKANIKILG